MAVAVTDARNDCEVRQILDRIAGKWSLLTIALLDGGPRRFTDPVVPPRVDYELTVLGSTLLATTQALVAWTEAHQSEIAAARATYDARALSSA